MDMFDVILGILNDIQLLAYKKCRNGQKQGSQMYWISGFGLLRELMGSRGIDLTVIHTKEKSKHFRLKKSENFGKFL